MKAFANAEAELDKEELNSGLKLRKAEMEGDGRFLIARVDGEAVSVVSWFEGQDRLLLHLGTRVPFRDRGFLLLRSEDGVGCCLDEGNFGIPIGDGRLLSCSMYAFQCVVRWDGDNAQSQHIQRACLRVIQGDQNDTGYDEHPQILHG